MADYNTPIDRAVENVLTSKRILLAHPGASKLNQQYATSDKVTSNLAETVTSRGRLRVGNNSKAFGATTNFNVSSSSIVSSIMLRAAVTKTANFNVSQEGWLFDAIDSVEVTFSSSLLSNMLIQGPVLREYMLMSCCGSSQREELLKRAGNCPQGASTDDLVGCIPLGYIIANCSFTKGNYGLDYATLNGPVTFQIKWKPSGNIFIRTAAGDVLPTEFSELELVAVTADVLDGAMSVKHALAADPSLVYTVPGRYLSAVSYSIASLNIGVSTPINLQSAPSGMLQAIVLSIRPTGSGDADGFLGNAAHTQLIRGSSVKLSQLSLLYGGQVLFQGNSHEEIKSYYASAFEGDDLSYREAGQQAANLNTGIVQQRDSNVYCIPLSYDARCVISKHLTENVPSYSGASLQLSFTVANNEVYKNASPFTPDADVAIGNAKPYQVWVMYVTNALLEVSGGSMDMQL